MFTSIEEAGIADFYGRNSTEEQADRGTIKNQTEYFLSWCSLNGYTPGTIYADEAVSGTTPLHRRDRGAALLKAIAEGRAAPTLLIYRLDRIGRELKVIIDAVDAITQGKVKLRSMTEPFDNYTPSGKLLYGMLASIAGFERDSIIQRAEEGQRRKARAGGWVGGSRAAYGYRVEGKRQSAHLVIDDSPVPSFGPDATRATVARWIFAEIGERNGSCIAVADTLNALHVPAYAGGRWNGATVAAMIANPVFKGVHRYGDERGGTSKLAGITAPAPALVEESLWDAANAQVQSNRRMSAKNRKHDYLLRGLIWCADCGAAYTGATTMPYKPTRPGTVAKPGVTYYRCNRTASKKQYVGKCPGGKAILQQAEDQIWQQITHYLTNPAEVITFIGKRQAKEDQTEGLRAESARLQKALDAKASERENIIHLYRRGTINLGELDKELDKVRTEEAVLKGEYERVQGMLVMQTASYEQTTAAADVLRMLYERFSPEGPMTWEQKREIVEALVNRITVKTVEVDGKKDTVVTVSFKFDPSYSSSSVYIEGQINYIETLLTPDAK